MGPDTGAGIIVSDLNDSDGVTGVAGQFVGVKFAECLRFGYIFFGNRQILCDDLVDSRLNFSKFLLRKRPVEAIVAFGFFLFDVSIKTSAAIEHSVHGLIENMFGRMHTRIRMSTDYQDIKSDKKPNICGNLRKSVSEFKPLAVAGILMHFLA